MPKHLNALFIVLVALLLLQNPALSERESSGTFVWVSIIADCCIGARLSAQRCMDSVGTQNLTVRVFKYPSGTPDDNENTTVSAVVYDPDGDINNITFANQHDGNYTFTYSFDTNGTYKFAITAHHQGGGMDATHDFNEYIYVRDFSIAVSFLNNNASLSPGNTVIVRNRVVNSDGNAFNDLNGNTSVFYPDSSILYLNQAMSAAGNGEYIFSFIAPSILGTYSATSAFSCNNESDSNDSGRFSVSVVTPPPEPIIVTTTILTGGEGGGWIGEVSPPVYREIIATIKDFKLEPFSVGVPATASLFVSHTSLVKQDFLAQLKIVRGTEVEFYSEQSVPSVMPGKSAKVSFAEMWVPIYAGTYIVTITLSSPDKRTKYDVQTIRYELAGDLRYDLTVECPSAIAKAGSSYDFKIVAANLGDYYEDITLNWWVESKAGNKIGASSSPIAVKPSLSAEKEVSVFIPASSPEGSYAARAKIIFGEVERTAFCNFSVKNPQTYYLEVLAGLENRLAGIEDAVNIIAAQKAEYYYLTKRVKELKDKLSRMKGKVIEFDFATIDDDIKEAEDEMDNLEEAIAGIKAEAALGYAATTNILLIVALILIILLIIVLLYQLYKRTRRYMPRIARQTEKLLEKLLGLEE